MAATSCSSGSHAASPPAAQLSTGADQALTITPGQMLAATGGATPVAFARPRTERWLRPRRHHGLHAGSGLHRHRRTDGDHRDAVSSTPSTPRRLRPSAGSTSRAVPTARRSLRCRPPDEVYGLTDRGPNVDGRTDDEKVLPVPGLSPQINRSRCRRLRRAGNHRSDCRVPTARRSSGLSTRRPIPARHLVDLDGTPLPTSDHGLDTEGLVALPTAPSGCPTNTGRSWSTSMRKARKSNGFRRSTARSARIVASHPQSGHGGFDHHARRLDAGRDHAVGVEDSGPERRGEVGPVHPDRHRNLATKAVSEFLYPLANPQETKVAVSEITALTDTTFLVDERDGELHPAPTRRLRRRHLRGDRRRPQAAVRARRTPPKPADCRSTASHRDAHRGHTDAEAPTR